MSKELMGWGEEFDDPQKTYARDMRAYESLVLPAGYSCSNFQEFDIKYCGEREDTAWEKHIRDNLFPFDDGWTFWQAEKLCYGKYLKPGPQNIGNCVGYSHCLLLASKHAHEITCEGDLEEPFGHYSRITPVMWIPYTYGVGRVYVGGGRLRGDGSLCSWQIDGTMQHGFVPSDTPGLPGPVPQGSSSTGRLLGSSKRELDRWRDKAAPFDLLDSIKIESGDQGLKVVTKAKSPLQICSSYGFGRPVYDSNRNLWVSKRSGSWAHSMQIVGIFELKGAWFVVVRNQWGQTYHKQPHPEIPRGCFVIDMDLFSRWVRDAYVSSIGEIQARDSFSDLLARREPS